MRDIPQPAPYRGWTFVAWDLIVRHPVATAPVILAALGISRVVPVHMIEFALFRRRNSETLRIAQSLKR